MNIKDQNSMNLIRKRLIVLIGISYFIFNICILLSNANIVRAIWNFVNIRSLIQFV